MKLIGPITKENAVGYIDENGSVRVPFIYQSLGRFCEGLASCVLGGKLGFLDSFNNLVVAARFDPENRYTMSDFWF